MAIGVDPTRAAQALPSPLKEATVLDPPLDANGWLRVEVDDQPGVAKTCPWDPRLDLQVMPGDAVAVMESDEGNSWALVWWSQSGLTPTPPSGGGEAWWSGATSPAADLGDVGDWYLNTTTGDVYEKTGPGAWTLRANIRGPIGPAGTNGINGTPGEKWFTGTGAPAGATGAVGDWYLASDTGDYSEKTGASAWTLRGNLKGPAGATGPVGTVYDADNLGTIKTWSRKTLPDGWVIGDGARYTQAAYPDGYAMARTEADAGNTLWSYRTSDFTFTVPDLTNAFVYGGTLANVGTRGGEATHLLTGAESGVNGSGVTGNDSPDHTHPFANQPNAKIGFGQTSPISGNAIGDLQSANTSGASARHTHGLVARDATTAHNNLPPYVLIGQIVKIKGVTVDSGGALVGPTGATGAKGDPGPWRSVWAAGTAYAVGDSISYTFGTPPITATYRRKVAGTTAGTPDADTTNWELIASGGSVGAAGGQAYSATFGNGTLTSFVIAHGLNTRNVTVSVYRTASPNDEVEVDVERTDVNAVTIRTLPTVPALNEYTVIVAAPGTNVVTQPVVFRGQRTADSAATSAGFNGPLPFTEQTDADNVYDGTKFQPTRSGWYQLTANLTMKGGTAGALPEVAICKNATNPPAAATQIASSLDALRSDGWVTLNCTALIQFNGTTDYAEVYVYTPSAVLIAGSSAEKSYFEGASVNVQPGPILPPPEVTVLPTTPVSGQEVYLRGDAAAAYGGPYLWHLRWNSATSRWEAVGEQYGMYIEALGSNNITAGVATPADLPNNPMSMTFPFAGVWECVLEMRADNAAEAQQVNLCLKVGAAAAVEYLNHRTGNWTDDSRRLRITIPSAATVVKLQSGTTTATARILSCRLFAAPLRLT